jgi:MFS family permease
VKHDDACILKQIEESNMKRLPDMTCAQPRRDTVAFEIVHEYPEASTPRRSLFAVIILVFLPFGAGYVLSYFFRTINALIPGALTSELHFGAADLGLLTAVYFVSAFVQLPIGNLVDRYGPRRMQSIVLLIAAAGATLFAIGGGFWTLLAGRALVAVGAGAAVIAGFKAIVLWFPPERVALMNGCYVMLGALGAIIATAPAEIIIAATGWCSLLAFAAAAAAILAAVTLIVVPEPARPKLCSATANYAALLGDQRFQRLVPLSTICIGTAWSLQGLWAATWLQDVEQLDHPAAVRHLFVTAAALSVGALILGFSAHRLRRHGMRAQDVLTAATAIFIAAEFALLLDLQVSSYVLWSIIATLGGASVLTYALIAEYFPPAMIRKAKAALSTCHIAGAFTLQCTIGFLIDRWAGHAGHYPPIAYRTAFALVVVLQIAALAWFAGFDRALAKIMAPFLRATRRTGEAMPSKCARFGFFSEFLAAMHESRRCQAAREIRLFEHLVPEARAYEARARQTHMQPCTVPEDRAVPARPSWRAMRASTLGRAWLAFAHRIAKPSARQIGGKQSS